MREELDALRVPDAPRVVSTASRTSIDTDELMKRYSGVFDRMTTSADYLAAQNDSKADELQEAMAVADRTEEEAMWRDSLEGSGDKEFRVAEGEAAAVVPLLAAEGANLPQGS